MVRNSRLGTIAVDATAESVTLDGEPMTCEPATTLAYSSATCSE